MLQSEIEQLVEILNAVKGHMTCLDIHEEFGYHTDYIRSTCKKYNIVLLSHTERNVLYIRQVCGVLTIDRIARNLGIQEDHLRRIAKDAGIKLLEPAKPLFLEGRRMARDQEVLQSARG